MDRAALGSFLRTLRERRDVHQFGFHDERRTPGLRREEVAELAVISTIHYTNIEQGRGAKPSVQVLASIATALRLDPGESQHLFDLADQVPPRPPGPDMVPSENISRLLQTLEGTPALVLSARCDVIAQNRAAAGLLEDFTAVPPDRRNLLRRRFLPGPEGPKDLWASSTSERLAVLSRQVGDTRAAGGRPWLEWMRSVL